MSERQSVADMFDRNDSTRVKLRLAARRRADSPEETAAERARKVSQSPPSSPRSRALPSGPAPNPTGFALALLMLSFVALILGAGALAWIGWAAIDGLADIFKEKDANG